VNLVWFLLPFAVLLAAWWAVLTLFPVPLRVFPTIADVVDAGLRLASDGTLFNHAGQSLLRVAIGSALAIALSIPLGVAMAINRWVAAYFTPVLRFFAALAGIAWIPLATLWFGYGFGAITFVIFNAVFFPVVYNTVLGVSTVPSEVRRAAASLGAGRWAMLTEVLVPGALPAIATGIRTGMGYAWRGLIAAEIIATSAGLGYMLFLARDFYKTEEMVLGMIIIGVLWVLLDRLALAPWERRTIERWGLTRRSGG
jgi:NitT/TauT family transport system permease protein/taurine transport system permease protein